MVLAHLLNYGPLILNGDRWLPEPSLSHPLVDVSINALSLAHRLVVVPLELGSLLLRWHSSTELMLRGSSLIGRPLVRFPSLGHYCLPDRFLLRYILLLNDFETLIVLFVLVVVLNCTYLLGLELGAGSSGRYEINDLANLLSLVEGLVELSVVLVPQDTCIRSKA